MNYINQDTYPDEFGFHEKHAKSELVLGLVWTHCNIVAEIALHLFDRAEFDTTGLQRELVLQAGLLHDVGVYACGGFEFLAVPPIEAPYSHHTFIGAQLLQAAGYHPSVVRSSYTHAGVGITPEDIRKFGMQLPAQDYSPVDLVEVLVCYTAKFHSKAPKFKNVETITSTLQMYGSDKVKLFQEWVKFFGEPNLTEIEQKYDGWHRSFKYQMEQQTIGQATPNFNSAGIAVRQ